MKLKALRELGRYWQDHLRLSDWSIKFDFMTKAHSKEHPAWNGFVIWDDQHHSASIRVSRDAQDITHAVVHELLHVRLEGHLPIEECNGSSNWEFVINTMATVLTGVSISGVET